MHTVAMSRPWLTTLGATACCAAVAACSSATSSATRTPSGAPQLPATTGPTVSTPRAGTATATVLIAEGSTEIDVITAALGSDLLRATTPSGSGQQPTLRSGADTLTVGLQSVAGGTGPNRLRVELNSAVSWTVMVNGGSTTLRIDTTAGGLHELDVLAGATIASVNLGQPAGIVTIVEHGGASAMVVTRPRAALTRVHGIGVGQLTIDGARQPRSGSFDVTPAGWSATSSGYDIDIDSGVGQLTVSTG